MPNCDCCRCTAYADIEPIGLSTELNVSNVVDECKTIGTTQRKRFLHGL